MTSGDKRCKICGDRPPAKGRTICETCKKQRQREKLDGEPQVQANQKSEKRVSAMQASQSSGEQPASSESEVPETHEEWLARRMIETGSKTTIKVAVGGYPADAFPRVELPAKYENSDLDHAINDVQYHQHTNLANINRD